MFTFLQVILLFAMFVAINLVVRVVELVLQGYMQRKQWNQKVDDTLAKLSREFIGTVKGMKWGDK